MTTATSLRSHFRRAASEEPYLEWNRRIGRLNILQCMGLRVLIFLVAIGECGMN